MTHVAVCVTHFKPDLQRGFRLISSHFIIELDCGEHAPHLIGVWSSEQTQPTDVAFVAQTRLAHGFSTLQLYALHHCTSSAMSSTLRHVVRITSGGYVKVAFIILGVRWRAKQPVWHQVHTAILLPVLVGKSRYRQPLSIHVLMQ